MTALTLQKITPYGPPPHRGNWNVLRHGRSIALIAAHYHGGAIACYVVDPLFHLPGTAHFTVHDHGSIEAALVAALDAIAEALGLELSADIASLEARLLSHQHRLRRAERRLKDCRHEEEMVQILTAKLAAARALQADAAPGRAA